MSKILEEKEEEINKLSNDNEILNKKIKDLEEDNRKFKDKNIELENEISKSPSNYQNQINNLQNIINQKN